MPQLLVVSQHAARFAELIELAGLSDCDAVYTNSTAQALPHCDTAEILFGAPDRLAPLLNACPRLRWVQSSWAGIKPLLASPRRDYTLTGVKGIFGPLMSEYVLAWLLGLERKLLSRATLPRWDSSVDGSLQGKLIGIMGTGSIGTHVAHTCQVFGLHTRGLNTSGALQTGFEHCYSREDIGSFADGLHYLLALLPDTPDSDNLIDATLLNRLRPGAIVINAGRANCVVDTDLCAALASGQLSHAVLDVLREEPLPEGHPLWAVENLHITSHTSAPTRAELIVDIFCANFRRYSAGQPLAHVVDFARGY